jgi:hypothetical protein
MAPRNLRTALQITAWLIAVGVPTGAQERVGEWKSAGTLSVGRYAAVGALLADGRAVIAGGYSFEQNRTHSSSELFDPTAGTWAEGPRMRFDRNFAEALALPSGDTLFVGGFRGRTGTTATSERVDARRAAFAQEAEDGAPPAIEERELFAATRLQDGRYLLTGGYSTVRRKTLDSAEIYDPKQASFVAVFGKLRHARFGHTGVLLPSGQVLIVGGKVLATEERVLPAELFDPVNGTFTDTGALTTGRDRCTAWVLQAPSGDRSRIRVLVAGGSAKEGGTAPARACEVYDAAAGKFDPGPNLVRDRMAHTATPLADGRVLLVGGWSNSDNATTRQAELWDPKTERFVPAGTLQHGRHDHVALRLRDGRVLVAGGKEAPARDGVETPLPAEIWNP